MISQGVCYLGEFSEIKFEKRIKRYGGEKFAIDRI
jgi:hypothetical protein